MMFLFFLLCKLQNSQNNKLTKTTTKKKLLEKNICSCYNVSHSTLLLLRVVELAREEKNT